MSKPIPATFLTRTLYISSSTYEALQALAEVQQAESADQVGETMLREVLTAKAHLPWLIVKRRDNKEKLREEYMAKLTPAKEEDALP